MSRAGNWTLSGRVAVITGASSGIGQQLAYDLSDRGVKVALAARSTDALDAVAAECKKRLGDEQGAIAVATDVTDPEACRALMDQTVADLGRIDILVANAGISMWARFDEIEDLSIFERIMRVNYLGAVYCSRFAYGQILQNKGLFVAVSSLTGIVGVPTRTAYAASKHAMQGFFDSLRIEVRNTGAEVLVISPGFVATPVRERALGADGQSLGYSKRDESDGTMSVEDCSRKMVKAIEDRQRDLVMMPRSTLTRAARLIAPGRVDEMAAKAVSDPGRPGAGSVLVET